MNENNISYKIYSIIASSLTKINTEIISINDIFGGYYNNYLIIPTIKIKKKNEFIKNIIIYKTVHASYNKIANNTITSDKAINDIFFISMINLKKINNYIEIDLPNFLNFERFICRINSKYITNFEETILSKLQYIKIKKNLKLTKKQKYILFLIENIKNVKLKQNIQKLFKINLNAINKNFILFSRPSYIKKYKYLDSDLNNIIKNKFETTKKEEKYLKNKIKNIKKYNLNNNLNTLFDYKRMNDNYSNQKQKNDTITMSNEGNFKNTQSYFSDSNEELSNYKFINKITIKKNKKTYNSKKYNYNEWNCFKKRYEKNWCHLFEKKIYFEKREKYLYKVSTKIINEISLKISLISNKRVEMKNQKDGDNINIDSLIDRIEYKQKNNIYVKKRKREKDICFQIALDSSLSTDSYINKEKKSSILKSLAHTIGSILNNLNINYSIASFYSNTRYECSYNIIKDFNEKWEKIKHRLNTQKPIGYTRIGPTIRHSGLRLSKMKSKKKIVLVLSDGKPTDYDEYEGIYGNNDIQQAIKELKKTSINCSFILVGENIKLKQTNVNILKNTKEIKKIILNSLIKSIKY
jgi:hypothetical protein